jgi:hypothetical protein
MLVVEDPTVEMEDLVVEMVDTSTSAEHLKQEVKEQTALAVVVEEQVTSALAEVEQDRDFVVVMES